MCIFKRECWQIFQKTHKHSSCTKSDKLTKQTAYLKLEKKNTTNYWIGKEVTTKNNNREGWGEIMLGVWNQLVRPSSSACAGCRVPEDSAGSGGGVCAASCGCSAIMSSVTWPLSSILRCRGRVKASPGLCKHKHIVNKKLRGTLNVVKTILARVWPRVIDEIRRSGIWIILQRGKIKHMILKTDKLYISKSRLLTHLCNP